MWGGLGSGYWVCLLLAAPAADFLVRLFMIQHDHGHGSFFRRRRAGVDTAIEAYGVPASFIVCEDIVAPGGIIANIGVHGVKADLHLERMLDRNIVITRRLVDIVSTPMLLRRHENTAERESDGFTRYRRD
jgi:hypothetical protein